MALTYEPIASTSLASDTSFIEFANIPQTFTDLVIVSSLRSNRTSASNDVPGLRFNSDTGSNYSRTLLFGTGSTAGSGRSSNATMIEATASTGPSASSGVFGIAMYQIMSYANTSVNKTVLVTCGDMVSELNRIVGLWRSTAGISTVRLYPIYGTAWVSGSTMSLYGIKAA